MTTYSSIAAGDIDTDSPITTSLMTKMRDNPIAITEGATGAPRIENASLKYKNLFTFDHVGDGALGSVTYSSNTSLDAGVYDYTSMTVNSGITLSLSSNREGPLVLRATGTITIAGTILAKNNTTNPASYTNECYGGGGGGGGATSGSSGDDGRPCYNVSGGTGGVWGGASSGNGSAIDQKNSELGLFLNSLFNGGGAGGDSAYGSTALGGAGGGIIILIADTIDLQSGGKIDASGDDGGTWSSVYGGGGGGGGLIVVAYRTLTENGSYDVSGGTGGAGSTGYEQGGDGGNGYTLKMLLGA